MASIWQRYPDFAKLLPVLQTSLQPDAPALSYTQWEAWLALYHGKWNGSVEPIYDDYAY